MLALSLSIALALFFYLSLSVLALKKIQGEEVKRRLETFREEEKPQEAEDKPNDLKKIPLYQRTIGRLLAQAMDFFSKFAPSALPQMMEQRIILAGKQGIWKPRTLVGIWFVSMIFWGFQGFRYTTGHPMSTFGGLVLIWGCLLFGPCCLSGC
jgi:tight adherence protein C